MYMQSFEARMALHLRPVSYCSPKIRCVESPARRVAMTAKKVTVEVISDIVCPWCWIGKRSIEAGAAQAGVEVDLQWKPFQLSPDSSIEGEDKMQMYMKKFGPDFKEFLLDPNNRVASRARALGADIKYVPGSKVFNTLPAHSLLHWTESNYGTQKANELHEVLFRKYHSEGLNLGPNDELLKASEEVGLPKEQIEEVLASGKLLSEVEREVQESRRKCSGVPFFEFPNGKTISGGVPPEAFVSVLQECAKA